MVFEFAVIVHLRQPDHHALAGGHMAEHLGEGDGFTDVLEQHGIPNKPWGAGFNLRVEMLVSFRFLLVARARILMCVLAASHRCTHCALVSAPAMRHNKRQALATAS